MNMITRTVELLEVVREKILVMRLVEPRTKKELRWQEPEAIYLADQLNSCITVRVVSEKIEL
jgi:hypothetical protein